MMREQDFQELAELAPGDDPVLSLYLHLDRHNRSTDEHKLALRKLLEEAAAGGAAQADVERIERFFEHEFDRQAKSLVCFSCQARKFWRAYPLLVPVRNAVHVGRRPYVKPLSDLWDNYECFAVVMVDREGARVMTFRLGALADTAGTLGAEVKRHRQGGLAAQKLQRMEDQEALRNLKEAAQWTAEYLAQQNVTKVVLSGTDQNLAEFKTQMPRGLTDKVVGQINLDVNASPAEAWEQASHVAQAAQRRQEADLLEQVITLARKGGAGALGLSDTLNALQQGRVHQLLVDPALRQPGGQCGQCGAVIAQSEVSVCPYCGGKLIPSRDVVNLAIHRAMDTGIKVSALEPNARLAEVGQIAAVLRY
jgi:peptide subunit release factor 1 (eRF1)